MAFAFIKGCLVGLPVVVTFIDHVGYVARVEGISMRPSLNPTNDFDDYVFLSKIPGQYTFGRGDVVSIISPKDPKERLIKRVIGMEGDVISTNGYRKPFVRIPQGHCWVEGDHRGHSLDSNTFGPVSMGLLTARAQYIVWPPSRWGFIKTVKTS